jgi:thiosulfate dehydrogenase
MDFNQLPDERKVQLASLLGSMSNGLMAFLFGLMATVALWGLMKNIPEQPHFAVVEEVAPNVPWDYEVFKDVDFTGPALNEQVALGRRLITSTADLLGPNSPNPMAGNNLNCSSCHLDGGSKPFAAPFVTVPSQFPQFRSRENKEGTIEDRINGCMQRSMNGKPLATDSEEMQAMVAYMEWLSLNKPRGEKVKGNQFLKLQYPDRAVDLKHGEAVYVEHCQLCHKADGQGERKPESNGYTYPPLWGPDSYNHGAGMHRVLTAAQFIKGNMPLGTTADEPLLTDEEAFDVAGYINSFERPLKANTEADFPDRKLKPMSTPYGPFADDFSEVQHKFGPFGEIAAYYEKEFGLTKSK